ncbi:MAG: S8 family peptidase [Planctomycetota bacterium]|jgi:subtilisin family serine protease
MKKTRFAFTLPILGLLLGFALFGGHLEAGEGEVLNDPLFPKQKKLFEKLEVLEAWELTTGSKDLRIGIIDSGYDFFHPDLKGRIVPGFYAPGSYHTEILENIAHGTLVASLIVARADNGEGMAGLAPGCRLLAVSHGMLEHVLLKFQKEFFKKNPNADMAAFHKAMRERMAEIQKFGQTWTRHVALSVSAGIRFLVQHEVKVINLSVFLSFRLIRSAEAKEALQKAFRLASEKDVVIVLGAGNNGIRSGDYPGDEADTLVVGASLLNDERWVDERTVRGRTIKRGSNFGKRLSVMAPVDRLVVCMPHDKRFYGSADGPTGKSKAEFEGMYDTRDIGATSCATPIVTSLVALVRSLRPDLDAKTVVTIVKKGCDDMGEEGFDEYTGHGRVNFRKTLHLAKSWGREKEDEGF